jgi:hypothetical protein
MARLPRFHSAQLLRGLHILVGTLGLIAFLETGQFMDRSLDHLAGMPDAPRALYRSAHIYILFAALLHLVLGTYVASAGPRLPRFVQYLGSVLLVGALACFVHGFYIETPAASVERPVTRTGIELSLAGVLLHVAAGLAALKGRMRQDAIPERPPTIPGGR